MNKYEFLISEWIQGPTLVLRKYSCECEPTGIREFETEHKVQDFMRDIVWCINILGRNPGCTFWPSMVASSARVWGWESILDLYTLYVQWL